MEPAINEPLKIKQLPIYIQIETTFEDQFKALGKDLKILIS